MKQLSTFERFRHHGGSLIEPRFGSAKRARHWFEKEPLPGFSGQTAEQLVQAGRTEEVRDFLAAVDAGIHS